VKNKYLENIKFRHIVQQKGETIATLHLRQGLVHCEYGEFFDRMLIEQFLHGLQLRGMCDKIFDKKPTTFAEACKIAHTLETTRDTTNKVKTPGSDASKAIHKLGCASPQYKRYKKDARQRFQLRERSGQKNTHYIYIPATRR